MKNEVDSGTDTELYTKSVTVDLDLPPRDRWGPALRPLKNEAVSYLNDWQDILNAHSEIDQKAWTRAVEEHLSQEHIEELAGIYETLTIGHPKITWSNLLLFNIMYELGSPIASTEVLAATANGTVLLGRNLDDHVVSPIVEVTFVKDGKPLFIAPTYLGQMGIHTAVKPGHWSIGMSTKHNNDVDTLERKLKQAQAGAWGHSFFLRQLMQKNMPYDQVVDSLQQAVLITSQTFVVAGTAPFQGAVIMRSADPGHSKLEKLDPREKWFFLQTSDDITPEQKESCCGTSVRSMRALTRSKMNAGTLMNVMHTPPIYQAGDAILFISSPTSGRYCSVKKKAVNSRDTSTRCSLSLW